eukprot:TRINITY_DN6703_c0_g1_i2.p1 TRINITY_DN6703_c0_g1~~TRINITY_DN6703_c0_g1_i2.p1  ORF type:complete len:696 (-),score=109.17 TRINITY_DN6703_c0_g1_i2:172-2259(-)
MTATMQQTMTWLVKLPAQERALMEEAVNYTFTRSDPAPQVSSRRFAIQTACVMIDERSVEAAVFFAERGHRLALLNFASGFNCGGGFDHKRGTQEEDIFRKTSVVLSLWPHRRSDDGAGVRRRGRWIGEFDKQLQRKKAWYPHTECGGIYSPHVRAVRVGGGHRDGDLRSQEDVAQLPSFAVLTVAAQKVGQEGPFDRRLLREKCRTALWMAAAHGNDIVVLGALGCGAFGNPAHAVANTFRQLLGPGGEFCTAFRLAVFAIPWVFGRDNFMTFAETFEVESNPERLLAVVARDGPPSEAFLHAEIDGGSDSQASANSCHRSASTLRRGTPPISIEATEDAGTVATQPEVASSGNTIGIVVPCTRASSSSPSSEGRGSGEQRRETSAETSLSHGALEDSIVRVSRFSQPLSSSEQSGVGVLAASEAITYSKTAVDKAESCLSGLPARSKVALVTMTGSLCPVTLGHLASFEEARKILLGENDVGRPRRLERFDSCIGVFNFNSDSHVRSKMQQKRDPFLNLRERRHLVQIATATCGWLGTSTPAERNTLLMFRQRWPQFHFVQFSLNGADDVAKYRKWSQASRDFRLITMGRPGYTQKVISGMQKARIDPDDGFFILGPELPDISSSELRRRLKSSEATVEALLDLVNPGVAAWCIAKWAQEGWSSQKNGDASHQLGSRRGKSDQQRSEFRNESS